MKFISLGLSNNVHCSPGGSNNSRVLPEFTEAATRKQVKTKVIFLTILWADNMNLRKKDEVLASNFESFLSVLLLVGTMSPLKKPMLIILKFSDIDSGF